MAAPRNYWEDVIITAKTEPSLLGRLKRKRFWALPLLVIATTAYRFAGGLIADLLAELPQPAGTIAAFIDQHTGAGDPAFIALAVGATAYWLARENWAGITKELYSMGLRAYNRQIREELISEALEQGIEQGIERGRNEVRSEVRQEILDELRAKTPEEIRQILEQADQTDGSPNNCG